MRRHELSETQWNRMKDLLPPERKPQGGRPAKSNREMLNAMVYWLNTGSLGETCLNDLDPGKVFTVDFVHGQKPVYGRTSWSI